MNGGSADSTVVPNGSGKSKFKTEEIAVEVDSQEQWFSLEDKSAERSKMELEMANGMKFDVLDHSEVAMSCLKPPEETISQSQVSKFILLNAEAVDAMV